MKERKIPKAWGLLMKSFCISMALTATNMSDPTSWFRLLIIWTSRGLNINAAFCGSSAHCPFLLLVASWDGTQPNGPVPVTSTLRAPISYSLCQSIFLRLVINVIMEDGSFWHFPLDPRNLGELVDVATRGRLPIYF